MFWGLIMEPNKRYTQTVGKSFHVSMASLDAVTADNAIVQVMLCYDERTYLLCSLKKDLAWQVPLDLNFQEGTKIAFTSNGRGHVHLTGYLIPDEEEDDLDLDELEEEEEDEEEEEEVPQLVSGKQPKRKANESPKENKKAKRLKAVPSQEESSEDEDDLENEEDEDSLEIDGEADDDSDEAEDDDDDDEEDEEDSEEEEVKTEVKPQQKKNKQQQQQQKQNAKQEKQKMVNGKDIKQEQSKQQTKKKTQEQQQQPQNNAQQPQKKRIVEGGVQIEDVKVGNGAPAKSGKFVSVYYVGRLKNGKKFDSTQQGEGFKFRLGKGEVIKGWDVGIAGMKVGGKRRITIPPTLAYGAKGSPPTIPGNSTLVFEVELKNVH